MKKILSMILCVMMIVSAFGSLAAFAADAVPANGYNQDNTAKKFSVYTADGLMAVAALINTGAVTPDYSIDFEADIDLTGKEWKSMGKDTATAYKGVVDGKGHTLKALTMTDAATTNNGFIGWAATGCVVKNLHFVGVNMTTTGAWNGTIIGSVAGVVTIDNCTTQGRISTTSNYAGGLVGRMGGLSFEKIDMKNEDGTPMLDKDGKQVQWDYFDVPKLTVTNCAVDMILSADTNYAAGIIGGDAFTQDADDDSKKTYTEPYVYPEVNCKNVFVTGSYKSSKGMASGFMGYFNLINATLENCFSAAILEGKATNQNGSFFARVRKANLKATNCYSISDLPFVGELENLASTVETKDGVTTVKAGSCMQAADGKVLDTLELVRCYALSTQGEGTVVTQPKLVATLIVNGKTKPLPTATDAEKAAFNDLVVAKVDAVPYKIEDIITFTETKNEAGEVTGYTITPDAADSKKHDCKISVPGMLKAELLAKADELAKTLFAADSKQRALVDAYMVAQGCPHTEYVDVVDAKYLAANATCTAKMTYFKSCSTCGVAHATDTFEYGEMAEHTWADRWGYDETNHFHACTVCRDATTDVAAHEFGDWTVDKEATETKEGKEIRTCATCGQVEERAIPKLEPAPKAEEPKEEKKGCGAAIGGASVMLVLAAAGAVVLRKKED